MFARKKSYYHIDEKPEKKGKKKHKVLFTVIAMMLLAGGAYTFLLVQSPEILATQPNTEEKQTLLTESKENFIKIERINLLVPFHEGDTEITLESGAWHRFPERGDPENGGNFILSAHRFQLGLTPNSTVDKSPFYHIDKLQEDDIIDIFYNNSWYKYQIKKTYSVEPDAVEIEEPSEEAKLTLYSCTLGGSADGRVVIEAHPISRTGETNENGGGAILL